MKRLFISGLLSCSLLLTGLIGEHKAEAASTGESVTEIALDYIGVPYLWGGSSPSGFDCSGFTSYTYKQAGVSLPRTTADQYTKGQPVSKNSLKKGDLVFFSTYKAGASHVGISLGGDKFVHASSSKGVTVSSLSESYYINTYIGSKRVDMSQTNGWFLSGGKWYFYNQGNMQVGWLKTEGQWYFLGANGAMLTGWIYWCGDWYYLNNSGAMVTDWNLTGGKWYYHYSSGVMAKNTTISGYKLGPDGAWIN
ncbi:NlpC/P60 family protein [Neobacillus sp. WH10]|uniref:C40 family peptidase n=1 Tax=Neobacillus sp. WH10 TaxID=3047873 RepID=UPI0024C1D78B|nr:NlpC/P60 family protein [Neobacillus sp. WH10]WHY76927.1 NlpC/P60 family protein [Neobacillus sp. WH10]